MFIGKKNCQNCEYLKWDEGEGSGDDPYGWLCTREDFKGKKEFDMIQKMERESYRERIKVCFKPRETK